jgi:type II secretory pathway pseudopilin PulG
MEESNPQLSPSAQNDQPSTPPNSDPKQPPPSPQSTSGLAIAGFATSFFAPPIGLILSIIALVKTKKNHQKGEGLAIAGIVISFTWGLISAGILLALVVTTFSAIQQRARDTERQSDINAIHSQIEAYYAQKVIYPTLDNLNDTAWRATNLPGLSPGALRDPQALDSIVANSPRTRAYAYEPSPAGCDNVNQKCTSYRLGTLLEAGGSYVKTSLN